jgi:3-hydroxyacyl-[acyl-carrier-protein] dehydratase
VEGPVLDIAKILAALPHRYPFLLVDRVVAVVKGERIHAYKNVTFNEGFFQGHFPGNPVMPGVLQLEALAQAGALLAHESAPFDPAQKVILLLAFDDVKFRRVVSPGDRLDLHVAIERQKGSFWRLSGQAKVDGQLASEAEIMATIADRKEQK